MKSATKKQPTKKELFENWKKEHKLSLSNAAGVPYDEKEIKALFEIFGDVEDGSNSILWTWLGNFDKLDFFEKGKARKEYLKIAAIFKKAGFLTTRACFGKTETGKCPSWIAMRLALISGNKIYKDATAIIANKDFEPTAKKYKYARYPKGIKVTFDDKAKVKEVCSAEFEPVYPNESLAGTRWSLSITAVAEILKQAQTCKTVKLDTI